MEINYYIEAIGLTPVVGMGLAGDMENCGGILSRVEQIGSSRC